MNAKYVCTNARRGKRDGVLRVHALFESRLRSRICMCIRVSPPRQSRWNESSCRNRNVRDGRHHLHRDVRVHGYVDVACRLLHGDALRRYGDGDDDRDESDSRPIHKRCHGHDDIHDRDRAHIHDDHDDHARDHDDGDHVHSDADTQSFSWTTSSAKPPATLSLPYPSSPPASSCSDRPSTSVEPRHSTTRIRKKHRSNRRR